MLDDQLACAGVPAALEGELHAVPAATEGFVYVSNTGEVSVLVDLLVRLLDATASLVA
jgi:hypothetical protein